MGGTIRLLLVDDHRILVEALARSLERAGGIEVVGTAHSIHQAGEQAARLQPDVILLDHELPDGEGVSAIGGLLEAAPETAVVMLTGHVDPATVQRAARAGAAGFLGKGSALVVVSEAVRAAALGESVVSGTQLANIRWGAVQESEAEVVLTDRERDVLVLLAEGLTNSAIACRLVLSHHTVNRHVANIAAKMGARSKLQVLAIALELGLLPRTGQPRS